MDIFSVLNMIGGLSLFLYGMSVMGDGLSKMAGGKLEAILEKLTKKRIFAVLLGAGVTAVIQSSSATTVMVVGFVNSGIMKLSQAVGIIMGANIGTTVTSWMLSLTGIKGSTIWLQLLKPSSFSPVLAALGIIFLMTSKGESKKKDVGGILLGFAILMFGMETMSGAVAGLAEIPAFTRMMTAFSNRWCCSDGNHPEFIRFCRYIAGVMCDRCRSLFCGCSNYHGTEHWNMHNQHNLFHWSE